MNGALVTSSPPKLVKYEAMCHAIDAAFRFDEVKDIRDKAAMLEAAARVAGNTQAEDRCYEIRRRAEAKAAKLYDQQEKAKGGGEVGVGRRGKKNGVAPPDPIPTLADLGTSKQEMAEWRKLSKVPPDKFDAAFKNGGKPSVAEIAGKKSAPRSAVSSAALWTWGRVLDFGRMGILKVTPAQCFAELDDHQREDIARHGPEIIAWLQQLLTLSKE
jgi:hypothetical protein